MSLTNPSEIDTAQRAVCSQAERPPAVRIAGMQSGIGTAADRLEATRMDRFEKALQHAEETASLLLVAALTLVIGGQIFFRYFLNDPLSWSEELAQFLLICLTFVAATAVLKRGEHFSIDAFVNLLPGRARRLVGLAAYAAQLVLLLGLAYYAMSIAQLYRGTSSVVLRIPEEVKAYVMTYSFLSMALHIALRMAGLVRGKP